MSEDLVSLRMMLIGAARPDQELWRQAAALAPVMVDFAAHDPEAAPNVLAKDGVDICIIDSVLADTSKVPVIEAARATRPVPLVFTSGPKGVTRLDGVDGHLGRPTEITSARKLVEICVRAKLPTRVLVVDDSGTMRRIVRKVLAASPFNLEIHEAAEGIEALNQLRAGSFGLVFVDYNMPGLNGFDMMMQIKREMPNVAVVMISSTLEHGIPEKARSKGALDFLKKPFYPADINAVLERYYGMHVPFK